MKSLKKTLTAAALAATLATTGCATIFHSGSQSLTMESQPSGATYRYGSYSGTTPETFRASRDELSHVATFEKTGYVTKTVPVETGIRGITWLNILFWPGFIVDFQYLIGRSPSEVVRELARTGTSFMPQIGQLPGAFFMICGCIPQV